MPAAHVLGLLHLVSANANAALLGASLDDDAQHRSPRPGESIIRHQPRVKVLWDTYVPLRFARSCEVVSSQGQFLLRPNAVCFRFVQSEGGYGVHPGVIRRSLCWREMRIWIAADLGSRSVRCEKGKLRQIRGCLQHADA